MATYTRPTAFGTVVGIRSALVDAAAAALDAMAPARSHSPAARATAPDVTGLDVDFYVRAA